MNKTTKVIIGVVVLILIIVFAWYFNKNQKQATNNELTTIKIGVIAPLSGSLAEYGIAFKNGIILANEESANTKVQYVFEDSQYDATKAISAFNKLVDIDKVALVMNWGAPTSEAIAPLVEKTKVPFLAFAINGTPSLTTQSQYIIRGGFNRADEFAKKQWEYFRDNGIKNVGIVKTELSYLNIIMDALKITKNSDESVVLIDNFQFGDNDFRTSIAKIKETKIDALGVYLASGQIAQFYKQAQVANLGIKTFGTDFFESQSEINASQGAMDGAVYPNMDIVADFANKYKKRFDNTSQITFAGSGYDIANILNAKVDFANVSSIMNSLKAVKGVNGALGMYNYSEIEGDRYFVKPTVIKIIQNGEFKTLSQ